MHLNLVQIAESFGVAEKVVQGWIDNEGLPHTPNHGQLLFDRAQVVEWAAGRGLAVQAGFLGAGESSLATNWRIASLLRTGGIWRDVPQAGLLDVFVRVADALPGATPPVRQLIEQRLRAPGGVTFAPIGGSFALPHPSARISLGRGAGAVALILLRDPLTLPAQLRADDVPVTRLLFFIAPSPRAHLDLLGRLSRMLGRSALRELLGQNAGDDEILRAVDAAEAAVAASSKPEVKPR